MYLPVGTLIVLSFLIFFFYRYSPKKELAKIEENSFEETTIINKYIGNWESRENSVSIALRLEKIDDAILEISVNNEVKLWHLEKVTKNKPILVHSNEDLRMTLTFDNDQLLYSVNINNKTASEVSEGASRPIVLYKK